MYVGYIVDSEEAKRRCGTSGGQIADSQTVAVRGRQRHDGWPLCTCSASRRGAPSSYVVETGKSQPRAFGRKICSH